MGGGGLRILPHKSWNVYNFKNRERVRRDEEQAAEEERKRLERAQQAEQEYRLGVLRARANQHQQQPDAEGEDTTPTNLVGPQLPADSGYTPLRARPAKRVHADRAHGSEKELARADRSQTSAHDDDLSPRRRKRSKKDEKEIELTTESGHINFFKDIEEGLTKHGKNKGHETEKKAELEAWQKKVGALVYLGQSVYDRKDGGPWYDKTPAGADCPMPPKDAAKVNAKQTQLDPMNDMKVYLKQKERSDKAVRDRAEKKSRRKVEDRDSHRRRHSRHRDGRRRSRSRSTSRSRSPQPPQPQIDPKLLELRKARLAREKEERNKVEGLLRAAAAASTPMTTPADMHSGYGTSSRYRHLLDTPAEVRQAQMERRGETQRHAPYSRQHESFSHRTSHHARSGSDERRRTDESLARARHSSYNDDRHQRRSRHRHN